MVTRKKEHNFFSPQNEKRQTYLMGKRVNELLDSTIKFVSSPMPKEKQFKMKTITLTDEFSHSGSVES